MDDEVMISIDEDLAEVFRTRFALTHQKKAKKGAIEWNDKITLIALLSHYNYRRREICRSF